jgi:Tfp pilus assembly protein PilW
MNKFIQFQNRKGITLIEIIVTFAVFSIIVVAILNFFQFNNKVYKKSVNLSQVQFDVRMASDYITTEVRNKSTISTTENILPNSINLAKLQNKYSFVKETTFEIVKQNSKYFLVYTITGSDMNNNNMYTLETNVLLNNIISATENSGSTIYYK